MHTRTIRTLYQLSKGRLCIIGVGGIFTPEDAYHKIKAGATAVQLITGFIYGGPTTIHTINKGLLRLLAKDGYKNISEAIGVEA
jgi:dihydroorotate dehydrogenase